MILESISVAPPPTGFFNCVAHELSFCRIFSDLWGRIIVKNFSTFLKRIKIIALVFVGLAKIFRCLKGCCGRRMWKRKKGGGGI